MDAGAGDGTADRRRQVAIADQLDPGARLADLGDERVVARPIEDDDGDVVDPPAERLGDPPQVVGRRVADVDLPRNDRPDAELLEVGVGGIDETALLGGGEDGDRAGLEATRFVPSSGSTAMSTSGASRRSSSSRRPTFSPI
jgi:hypothetical protein